jgi:hypothetical protein
VSAQGNNIPVTTVKTPSIATTLFCSSVNCISFPKKEFSLIRLVTHNKMLVWLACHSYIYVLFFSFFHDRPIESREPSFNRASTTKSGSTQSSTTKSGSTRLSLTLPSFKHRSELFTLKTEGEILASPNLKAFSLSDLKVATKNFRLDSLIGERIFSYFYKG